MGPTSGCMDVNSVAGTFCYVNRFLVRDNIVWVTMTMTRAFWKSPTGGAERSAASRESWLVWNKTPFRSRQLAGSLHEGTIQVISPAPCGGHNTGVQRESLLVFSSLGTQWKWYPISPSEECRLRMHWGEKGKSWLTVHRTDGSFHWLDHRKPPLHWGPEGNLHGTWASSHGAHSRTTFPDFLVTNLLIFTIQCSWPASQSITHRSLVRVDPSPKPPLLQSKEDPRLAKMLSTGHFPFTAVLWDHSWVLNGAQCSGQHFAQSFCTQVSFPPLLSRHWKLWRESRER